jgi:hypothetical protein
VITFAREEGRISAVAQMNEALAGQARTSNAQIFSLEETLRDSERTKSEAVRSLEELKGPDLNDTANLVRREISSI